MGKLESAFSTEVRKDIEARLPGCIILKNDPNLQQGIFDLVILWRRHWGALEVKRSRDAAEQPNQRWYVDKANQMSFGAFIYPENKEDVLDAMEFAFRARR